MSHTDAKLRSILDRETIAIVGCSGSSGKLAHDIPKYLQEQGYRIVPINPTAETILGAKSYESLAEVEETIRLLGVFRPSEELGDIASQVLKRDDVPIVWTQIGISDADAEAAIAKSGRTLVINECLRCEHKRLFGKES